MLNKKISPPLGILLIVLAALVVGVLVYFGYFYKLPEGYIPSIIIYQTFSTKEECEEKTNCQCGFVNCDDVPREKSYEEICGTDFKKGWQCIKSESEYEYKVGSEEEKEEKIIIDLKECKKEERHFAWWSFGSVEVKVKEFQFGLCTFDYSLETEGGYVVYECNSPVSLEKITISEFHNQAGMRWIDCSFDVSRFCKKIKTGNVFKDAGDI